MLPQQDQVQQFAYEEYNPDPVPILREEVKQVRAVNEPGFAYLN
jgi:hypothetical protein